MGCGIAGTQTSEDCVVGKQGMGIHLISGSTNSQSLHCFAGARGRCVFRALLNSQGRQMRFEAVEVSELFSWLLCLPKDREWGWASNDELNPALFEVSGRNSQYQL